MGGRTSLSLLFAPAAALLAAWPEATFGQEIDLNYDALSSLEEPIAIPLGDVTLSLTGLGDLPLVATLDSETREEGVEPGFIGNFQIAAQTQLSNRWRVGAAYFGQYATDAFGSFGNREGYSDNVAAFVGTSFGTLLGGNVGGQVRELTRRRRGVGNAALAFDDFYGGLDDWGGAYFGRFGPSLLSAAVDDDGDFELGGTFQRPIGRRDYRFSGRIARGHFTPGGPASRFGTFGAAGVAEMAYGTSLFDLGFGYERLDSALVDADRWYVSAGARTQVGSLTLSAEGHYGQVSDEAETSASLGAAYALGRGLSLNLGVNYREADIRPGDIFILSAEEVQALASLRYSF